MNRMDQKDEKEPEKKVFELTETDILNKTRVRIEPGQKLVIILKQDTQDVSD
jgi:hypothetical protein